MDNSKGNKCWSIIGGLASLVSLGVVEKVKLSFSLPMHGHTDVDATIAKVIERVCNANLPKFSDFVEACKDAIKSQYSKVLEVCNKCKLLN
jgi:hypothetical protein